VVYLTPVFDPGGAERQMLTVATALRDLHEDARYPSWPRFEVKFVVMSGQGALAEEARSRGIAVTHLGMGRPHGRAALPRAALDLAPAARRYLGVVRHADIVDAWLVPAYTFAGMLQPIARVPILMAGRRNLLDVHRTHSRLRELLATSAMRRVAAVVANSQAAADAAVRNEGIDPSRVHVIRNAVTPVAPSQAVRDRLRGQWGATPDDIVLGCVANFAPGKGHDLLLDVTERIVRSHPRARFVFVGEGPLRSYLASEIERRGLEGRVVLHTGERDARPVYQAFDIAIQASESEGFPNAVLEAAAAGLPIVATDVGGTREILVDTTLGILVRRRDGSALADAVDALVADPELRARLGRAAAVRVNEFSPERLAIETGALYLQLLGRDETSISPSLRSDATGSVAEHRTDVVAAAVTKA
jgi:glycosyltransferase involved in cell wall biosynthesis